MNAATRVSAPPPPSLQLVSSTPAPAADEAPETDAVLARPRRSWLGLGLAVGGFALGALAHALSVPSATATPPPVVTAAASEPPAPAPAPIAPAPKPASPTPKFDTPKPAGVARLLARGARLLERGQFRTALGVFQVSVVRAPRNADGWYGLALARAELGDRKLARRAAMKALALAPKHGPALVLKGLLDQLAHDEPGARKSYQQYLATHPQGAWASELTAVLNTP